MLHSFQRLRPLAAAAAATLLTALLPACGGSGGGGEPSAAVLAALGEKAFADRSLSASGQLSCAGCHDPAHAHAPANSLGVQPGGATLDQQGRRNPPSINYLATNRAFRFDAAGRPVGGFFWDGRAASLQAQAGQPLLDAVEMANNSRAEVVGRLARATYADGFKAAFGADIFSRPDEAFERLTQALAQYQLDDPAFRAYSSRYDAFLRGTAALGEAERRGLALFENPAKGNCAACHPSARAADGSLPLFTSFGYGNLGVPRNPDIIRNEDPRYFDLGLCNRPELNTRYELCGAFKVPTLRNVAQRGAFFHNGRFTSLREVLGFYARRDTNPEQWYPLEADGSVRKFDDLPAHYRGNVETRLAPYNRQPGDAPALSEAEIDDLLAFLQTLSDGWKP